MAKKTIILKTRENFQDLGLSKEFLYFCTKNTIRKLKKNNELNLIKIKNFCSSKKPVKGFPGGTVVESLPANAGDTGSSPGLGGSHMPWSD